MPVSDAGNSRELGRLNALSTEQSRDELSELDLLPTAELVSLMCRDVRRVPDAVATAQEAIIRAVEGVVERLERGGRLIYVGAGTAGRLGMLDAAEAGPTFNIAPDRVIALIAGGNGAFDTAMEAAEDDREGGAAAIRALAVEHHDVVVGIAASGRTPYVLGAIDAANDAGAFTIGLACNLGTPLAASAAMTVEVVVGPEIIAGSTRLNAGTAQKIILNIISTAAMVRLGRTYGGLMVDLRVTNAKLRERATRIVAEIAGTGRDEARKALELSDWRPKVAAAMIVGRTDRATATQVIDRHRGRLRPALDELAGSSTKRQPAVRGADRRLGVAAAYVDGALVPGDISIRDGEITGVGLAGPGSGLAIPSLVDAQVNGYAGIDILSADTAGLSVVGEELLRAGVGAYQPTLITAPESDTLRALSRIAALDDDPSRRATVTGVHLEGPFLSPERAGTHPREHLRAPDPALLERLLAAGPVRMVTLAPELAGATELVRICRARGVAVALGHSAATAAEADAGFAAGAWAVTHLFNAMAPITARSPGLAGAALANPRVNVQLIADGAHVSDELIRLAFAAAAGRCSLVSDAVAAAGGPDGTYRLGAVHVEVRDGIARRDDGTLAGSTAPLSDGLARLACLGIDRRMAVAAVTGLPARLLGIHGAGRLAPGIPANLLVVDDELRIQTVLAMGQQLETFEQAPAAG